MKKPANQSERTVEQRLEDLERWTEIPLRQAALKAGYRLEPIEPAQDISEPTAKKKSVKSLEETVKSTFVLPRSRWKKMSNLATNEGTSLQAILLEAVEAHFKKRNLPF